jgi:hypothetical protein
LKRLLVGVLVGLAVGAPAQADSLDTVTALRKETGLAVKRPPLSPLTEAQARRVFARYLRREAQADGGEAPWVETCRHSRRGFRCVGSYVARKPCEWPADGNLFSPCVRPPGRETRVLVARVQRLGRALWVYAQ